MATNTMNRINIPVEAREVKANLARQDIVMKTEAGYGDEYNESHQHPCGST